MHSLKHIGPLKNTEDSPDVLLSASAKTAVRAIFSAAVIILFIIAAFQRNFVWDTKLSLWSDAAKKSPQKSRAHNNLGNCNMLLARPFEAIEEYKIAVALDPRNIEAYYNLGINLEDVGILNQAAYYYDIFCRHAPQAYSDQKKQSCERVQSLSRGMKVTR